MKLSLETWIDIGMNCNIISKRVNFQFDFVSLRYKLIHVLFLVVKHLRFHQIRGHDLLIKLERMSSNVGLEILQEEYS